MFETNTDLEFDEIFSEPFKSDQSEAAKHTLENENSSVATNKKPCLDYNAPAVSTRSTTFLKKICNDSSINSEPSINSPQFKSISSFNPVLLKVRQNSVSSPVKKAVLRKFPGPAGLLPEKRDYDIRALEVANTKETKQVDMDIFSQMSATAFREGPWEKMSKDFSTCGSSNKVSLLDKYNIAWIKAKMKTNKLINQKAPFLAAMIQKFECLKLKTSVVTMMLKDATGIIHGTMVYDLYEEYVSDLKVGSVVILKQVGVLTTDQGSNHYLTITVNNLVRIYSKESTDPNNQDIPSIAEVKVTVIQKFSVEDFLKNIREVKSRHKAAQLEWKLNPAPDFENVNLNLRSLSDGCLSTCRVEPPKVQKTEIKNVHTDSSKFISSPGSITLKTKNIHNSNTTMKSDATVINNSKSFPFMSTCNSFLSNSTANVSLSKENNVGLISSGNTKSRFNFKARVNNLNKSSEVSPHQPASTHCENSKIVPLENRIGSANPQSVEYKNPALFISDTNKNKLEPIVIYENKYNNPYQPTSSNMSSIINCSQVSITSDNLEHSAILQNVFEGVDTDLLFEDF